MTWNQGHFRKRRRRCLWSCGFILLAGLLGSVCRLRLAHGALARALQLPECFVLLQQFLRPSQHSSLISVTAIPEGCSEGQAPDECEQSAESLQFARERLNRQFSQAGGQVSDRGVGWDTRELELGPNELPEVGTVLLANPAAFFGRERMPYPAATIRTGRIVPNASASRHDKAASLPVVLLIRKTTYGVEGLVLGWWSGRLLGDPELNFTQFQTRPLYLGGVVKRPFSFLHSYPEMPSARRLSGDGLSTSEDFGAACSWISEGNGSSMRFKFFMNGVWWKNEEYAELSSAADVWLPVTVNLNLIMREPDSSFEEPLWVQIADKAGGKIRQLAEEYGLLPTP